MSEIHVAALIAALILIAEHYFPWELLLRRKLPRLAAYGLGVLALAVPLSALYAVWALNSIAIESWFYLRALWMVIIAGGAAVSACHLLDYVLEQVNLAHDLQELLQLREAQRERPDQRS